MTNPDFDPTEPTNRVLRGRVGGDGLKTVDWDGKDNSGANFPAKEDYPARIRVHAGEYHFPYGDVENARSGGPTYTLLNPPGGVCPVTYRWLQRRLLRTIAAYRLLDGDTRPYRQYHQRFSYRG
ncbi:MAG: hypothetical protein U5L04_04510 [Trueperaceae bacterium]|nr:hypothetical protein [Trueperaceae bacterium]